MSNNKVDLVEVETTNPVKEFILGLLLRPFVKKEQFVFRGYDRVYILETKEVVPAKKAPKKVAKKAKK